MPRWMGRVFNVVQAPPPMNDGESFVQHRNALCNIKAESPQVGLRNPGDAIMREE